MTDLSPGSYTGTLVASDSFGCTATVTTAPANVYAPIVVHIDRTAPALACPSMTSDAVTYAANVSGGDGNYSYTWNGATCSGAQCVIDRSDSNFCFSQSFSLTVDDGSPLCPPATSETETCGPGGSAGLARRREPLTLAGGWVVRSPCVATPFRRSYSPARAGPRNPWRRVEDGRRIRGFPPYLPASYGLLPRAGPPGP